MMIKVVFLGMMAACAMAQFPMMGLGGFGGLDLKNIKDMIPEGTFDLIKNMKPEDIKNAVANMPPEMVEMLKGMGISEDQLKEAVNNMPDDFDVSSIIDQAKDNIGALIDSSKDEEMSGMKDEARKHLEELGLDLSGGANGLMSQILPKFTEMIGESLKAEGIDIDDKEQLREEVRKQMMDFAGAEEDDSDEEIKSKLLKNFLIEMKENGFEINTDNTEEGIGELKKQIVGQLKDLGFELDDDVDIRNLPEMLKKMMKSEKFNPQQLMQMVAPMMQGPPMMGPPPMMYAPPMRMHPGMNLNLDININQRPADFPVVTPSYVQGAEDALLHAFGDDSDVVRHVMAVKFGAETGTVMEEDLHELLEDLMHYRVEARVLMAKNQMLRNKLYDGML